MPPRSPLVEAWFRGLASRLRSESIVVDEGELRLLLGDARTRLPGVSFDPEGLLEHLARSSSTAFPDRASLGALHLADLVLAFAVVQGDEAARAIFLRDVWSDLAATAGDRGEEVRNELFDPASTKGLLSYSGRGSLRAWLKVLLLRREGGTPRQGGRRELREPEEVRALDVARAAIEGALSGMTKEERSALRLAFSGKNGIKGPKDEATKALEQALLLRTRRHLFSRGLDREKGEEALREVWRDLAALVLRS